MQFHLCQRYFLWVTQKTPKHTQTRPEHWSNRNCGPSKHPLSWPTVEKQQSQTNSSQRQIEAVTEKSKARRDLAQTSPDLIPIFCKSSWWQKANPILQYLFLCYLSFWWKGSRWLWGLKVEKLPHFPLWSVSLGGLHMSQSTRLSWQPLLRHLMDLWVLFAENIKKNSGLLKAEPGGTCGYKCSSPWGSRSLWWACSLSPKDTLL